MDWGKRQGNSNLCSAIRTSIGRCFLRHLLLPLEDVRTLRTFWSGLGSVIGDKGAHIIRDVLSCGKARCQVCNVMSNCDSFKS